MSSEILKKYKIKAKKALGQNFLVNENTVDKIADTIEVSWQNIVEVWPWYGALTEKLLDRTPKSLSLVELDKDMIVILEDRIKNGDLLIKWVDFSINNKNILKFEPEFKNYYVIANIPYYITSPILRHFLYGVENKPEAMLILMQEEVGDKILWKKKEKSSVLSLFIEKKSDVTKIIDVPKTDFVPVPKIDSSVLLFKYNDKYPEVDDKEFFRIIKIWFSAARKKLIKNFVNSWYKKEDILIIFDELEIDEKIRWEDLNLKTWIEIIKRM